MLTTIVPIPIYIHIRFALWLILAGVSLVEFYRKRELRSAGWPLHRCIVVVVNITAFSEIFLWLFCIFYLRQIQVLQLVFICLTIFFKNLAYAAFLFVLLLVSSGYCITRDQLGHLKNRIIYIPLIYFGSTTAMDFILFSVSGQNYFVVGESVPLKNATLSGIGNYVLLVSLLLYFIVSIMAWFYIFDSLSSELRKLKPRTRQQDLPANSSANDTSDENSQNQQNGNNGEQVGININKEKSTNIFQEVEMMEEQEGTDISTVAELMVLNQKRKLMTRFGYGVAVYVLLSLGVLVIPVFIVDAVQAIVIISQNVAQLIFLAALLWVFRPKTDSPYLQIPTDIDNGYNPEALSTQLAVIHEHELENSKHSSPDEEQTSRSKSANKMYIPEPKYSSKKKQDFTIGDEEDDLVIDDESPKSDKKQQKQNLLEENTSHM